MALTDRVTPLGDNIVCVPVDGESESKGGIVIPDNVDATGACIGRVVAVGPGSMLQSGDRKQIEVVVGDRIMYPRSGRIQIAAELRIDGEDCTVISEKDVYLIDRPPA